MIRVEIRVGRIDEARMIICYAQTRATFWFRQGRVSVRRSSRVRVRVTVWVRVRVRVRVRFRDSYRQSWMRGGVH